MTADSPDLSATPSSFVSSIDLVRVDFSHHLKN